MQKSHFKIKKKKRKLNFKRVIIFLIVLFLLYFLISEAMSSKIKNIYILNNNIVSDKEVMEDLDILDYPSFFENFMGLKKRISNKYIKDIKVRKKIWNRLYIEVIEYTPLCIYGDEVLLDNGSLVENVYDIDYLPYVSNDITDVFDKFVLSFAKINKDILYRVSEISYAPVDVDDERFLLYMIDGNSVYITLSKITKLNKYDKILQRMGEKKGIVYLDSGDYVEIKD